MGSRMNWAKCSSYRKTRNNDIEGLAIPLNEMHDDIRTKKYAPLSMAIYKRECVDNVNKSKQNIGYKVFSIGNKIYDLNHEFKVSLISIDNKIIHEKYGIGKIHNIFLPDKFDVIFRYPDGNVTLSYTLGVINKSIIEHITLFLSNKGRDLKLNKIDDKQYKIHIVPVPRKLRIEKTAL